MWGLVLAKLAKVVIPMVLPKLGAVAVSALGALERKLDAMGLSKDEVQDDLWPTALAIVRGINADHPDWPGPQKAQWARDAIRQLLINKGKSPDNQAVNWIIESAVTFDAQSGGAG